MSPSNNAENRKFIGILSPEVASYFIAGGCAGAASRTVVSPLERLKIIQQVQPKGSTQYKGVWKSLVRMWKEEGFKGYMRGNGINCLRIVPYRKVDVNQWFTRGSRELDTPKRLASGALAGITSVSTKATTNSPKLINAIHTKLTIWGMTMKIMREEGGIRGLYRGLVATAFGVAPYVGINFAAYEFLR
ncbi:hypothetical protein MPER_07464, partial [Moniliophthora perniciosa FA553]